ncbi:uncharacterized protein LOC116616269 [Nematostella vectensis]|uniref:uncharacterized protein LOC116616269 n=1 Tax=Nematostella vectensis TaxID=45351 RepID=UPI00139028D9|nr:uncharacterized protein LOC116616269 [Nematostella vectensis]
MLNLKVIGLLLAISVVIAQENKEEIVLQEFPEGRLAEDEKSKGKDDYAGTAQQAFDPTCLIWTRRQTCNNRKKKRQLKKTEKDYQQIFRDDTTSSSYTLEKRRARPDKRMRTIQHQNERIDRSQEAQVLT